MAGPPSFGGVASLLWRVRGAGLEETRRTVEPVKRLEYLMEFWRKRRPDWAA